MVAFAPFAADNVNSRGLLTLLPQKLAYIICNALTLALGLWKCSSMGLLPMGTADWLAFEKRGEVSGNSVRFRCAPQLMLYSLRRYFYLSELWLVVFISDPLSHVSSESIIYTTLLPFGQAITPLLLVLRFTPIMIMTRSSIRYTFSKG